MSNGKRQDDWGSKSTSNTRNTSSTDSSVNNSSTQVQGKAEWTNSSNNSSYTNTHSGEENQLYRSNSESSSSSGFSKTNNSSDDYSVINSAWDDTTTDGKTVGSNSRDVYSEANSNANSSYDDGKSKNTSNTDTYTVNHSQETNSINGSKYWNNNRGNNYSVTQSNDTQNYKHGPETRSHNRDTYSVSKSNSSSSNSSGKVSSKNQQENYSENHAQWDSEYKADTYTTQSSSDESTITATKSNSSTEGSNSTSSNSSDTSTTRNSQTVTTYKDGRKTENGSSSYEKWSSESTSDSKGVASSVSKYSSWSESYSKSYFKGGYSWTETVSGSDSESVTKGGVSTSNGSSWSWTRSGTVWDDGPNNWSESWSKSSWKDGKYAPNESEETGGSFDPEGTQAPTNNLPEFGEAPRLNKAPKQQVPLDLVKPPKPSDDIWQLPTVIFKEPQFKEVFGSSGSDSASGGSGNDDLANNPSGGGGSGGKLPPNKRFLALTQVIQELLRFFKPLGEFVAGAVYQWLRNNGEPATWLLQIFSPGWKGLEQDVERGLPQTFAFNAGRTFGDGAALVTGILEIMAGSGTAAGGASLCITGLPCIGGAPAIAAGVALKLHGASVASTALANIGKLFRGRQIVYHSSADDSTGNTGGRPYEKPTSIRKQDTNTVVQWPASPQQPPPTVIFGEPKPGVIEVTDIFKRDLPDRSAGRMIVDALEMAGVLKRGKPTTIRLSGILEKRTLQQIKDGVSVENTRLGNTLKNAINELGGRPTSWKTGEIIDKRWIEVTISY